MPIIETGEIKDSIRRTCELLENGVPVILDKETAETTNCYAYSLGITYHGLKGRHFNPGFTEGLSYYGKEAEELMEKIQIDLKNLDISFRKLDLEEDKDLGENEFLIKVFYTPPNEKLPNGDFHFVRQDRKTGKWCHKLGWNRQPDLVQSDQGYEGPIPGSEPTTFTRHETDGFTYVYDPVGYFAITEV